MTNKPSKIKSPAAVSSTPLVGPSDRTIKLRLKELRTLIDTSKDPTEKRIAYGMECSILWARRKTVGWEAPAVIARDLSNMLHRELRSGPAKDALLSSKAIIYSGWAGMLPNGNIVDRREHPEAVPIPANKLFGTPSPNACPHGE